MLLLKKELVAAVEEFIAAHPEMGYKSNSDFVSDAVRRRIEEVKHFAPTA